MRYRDGRFTNNPSRGFDKQIQSLPDGTRGAVFDRDDAVIGTSMLDPGKDFGDRRGRVIFRSRAEDARSRAVRVRVFRPEKRNTDGIFERSSPRNDVLEYRCHSRIRQRTAVFRNHAFDDFGLARRLIYGRVRKAFGFSDSGNQSGALVQSAKDPRIKNIDLLSQSLNVIRPRCSPSGPRMPGRFQYRIRSVYFFTADLRPSKLRRPANSRFSNPLLSVDRTPPHMTPVTGSHSGVSGGCQIRLVCGDPSASLCTIKSRRGPGEVREIHRHQRQNARREEREHAGDECRQRPANAHGSTESRH